MIPYASLLFSRAEKANALYLFSGSIKDPQIQTYFLLMSKFSENRR